MSHVVGVSGKRVLAVFAHPDDEGQVTGTLAAFVAEGNSVTLVCATRGELGRIKHPFLATRENVGYVRELELRTAMAQIGVTDVRFLGFRDSGHRDTPESEDERCFHQQSKAVAVAAILNAMRDVRPHLVFTFRPDGGSGHPDHVAGHQHTLTAYDGCGDPAFLPDCGAPWTPERLYWSVGSWRRRASVRLQMDRRGLLYEPMSDEARARSEAQLAQPDEQAHVTVDCSPHVGAILRATSMHGTQLSDMYPLDNVPDDLAVEIYGQERFDQGRPQWPNGGPSRTDFA